MCAKKRISCYLIIKMCVYDFFWLNVFVFVVVSNEAWIDCWSHNDQHVSSSLLILIISALTRTKLTSHARTEIALPQFWFDYSIGSWKYFLQVKMCECESLASSFFFYRMNRTNENAFDNISHSDCMRKKIIHT